MLHQKGESLLKTAKLPEIKGKMERSMVCRKILIILTG
jgi:hypothetical protein